MPNGLAPVGAAPAVATDVAAAVAVASVVVVPCTAATWHNKFQICYETCIRTCPSWRPTLSLQPPADVLGENFRVPACDFHSVLSATPAFTLSKISITARFHRVLQVKF